MHFIIFIREWIHFFLTLINFIKNPSFLLVDWRASVRDIGIENGLICYLCPTYYSLLSISGPHHGGCCNIQSIGFALLLLMDGLSIWSLIRFVINLGTQYLNAEDGIYLMVLLVTGLEGLLFLSIALSGCRGGVCCHRDDLHIQVVVTCVT